MKVTKLHLIITTPLGHELHPRSYHVDDILEYGEDSLNRDMIKDKFKVDITDFIWSAITEGNTISLEPEIDYGNEFGKMWLDLSAEGKRLILHCLKNGQKINAIRSYREQTGESLTPSKEMIEWVIKTILPLVT